MILPSEAQCLNYFKEYHVPDNIFKHCLRVQSVANFIAKRICASGFGLNYELVSRLALLHDLFKMITIKDFGSGEHHGAAINSAQQGFWNELKKKYPQSYEGEVAYDVFKERFPELAVALSNVSNPHYNNHNWEESIVHYADMRVFKDNVVTVTERFAYLEKRYPREPEVWKRYLEKIKKLEQTVMAAAKIEPQQLGAAIQDE